MSHQLNIILSILIIISLIILCCNQEHFDSIIFNPGFNKISITPYYNPYHQYLQPSKLDYLIPNLDPNMSPVSKTWLANKTYQCSTYNNKDGLSPTQPQDCPDSSFTYVDDMSYFVPSIRDNPTSKYPGCIQLKINSNYCYSNPYGEYIPNVDVLEQQSP